VKKFRYHEMLPREILERRDSCPIAFVGLGTLEWHAEHAAVGLDGLKVECLCELAAHASGGFAFPTLWYGEPRSVEHMEADQEDTPAIRRALRLRPVTPGATAEGEAEIARFQALVRALVLELYGLEMRVVCIICGHYPLLQWAHQVGEQINAERADAVTIVGTDDQFVDRAPEGTELPGNDHAGVWETSYLWHLRPECVDMSVYESPNHDRLVGVLGEDPRDRASPELGGRACELIVAGMAGKARATLEALATGVPVGRRRQQRPG
jgi:creatinine amidohydrolase